MDKLEEYRRKRRFGRTPEPSGEPDAVEAKVPRAKEREIPRFARNDGTMAGGARHGDALKRAPTSEEEVRLAARTGVGWNVRMGKLEEYRRKQRFDRR